MTYQHAHAALVDDDNIVRQVIVVPYLGDDDTRVTEYCNGIGLPGRWLDTSYLGARRGKYAGVGDHYDPGLDEFYDPGSDEFTNPTVDEGVGDHYDPGLDEFYDPGSDDFTNPTVDEGDP